MSRHIVLPACALALIVLLPRPVTGALAATERGSVELTPCPIPGGLGEMLCGSYEVFENRARRSGRKIGLRVAVLPAWDEDRQPDPVLFFAGGPGGSATELAPVLAFVYADLRERRDFLLIDVRGTGKSGPLDCPYQSEDDDRGREEVLETFLPVDRLPECREALAERTDLRHYTTPVVVDDVDEIRAALGYERLNLKGGSYGTRPVQVYLRRHPERVRTAMKEEAAALGPLPRTQIEEKQTAIVQQVRQLETQGDIAVDREPTDRAA